MEWVKNWIPLITSLGGVIAMAFYAGATFQRIKNLENLTISLFTGEKECRTAREAAEKSCKKDREEVEAVLHGRVTDLASRVSHLEGRLN